MQTRSLRRTRTIALAGASLVAGVGVAVTSAGPATATTAPVAAARAAAHKAPAKQTVLSARQKHNVKRWGVAVLPISEPKLVARGFAKRHIKDLLAAKRWAQTPEVRYIRQRESGNTYRINTGNGYYGAYQFDHGTWLGSGGGRFSSYAHQSPAWIQDYVAYMCFKARGWQPWGGKPRV